jgi:peptidoglycan/xylan/chitin deacetylase (PgdA/CDA1 family)
VRTPVSAVLISIDDGHDSVAMYALPALKRRGLKAALFVCPGLVGTSPAGPQGYGGFMD